MPLGLKPGGAPQGDPGPRQAAGGLLPGPCCGRAAQLRLPGPRGPRCVRPGPGAHPRAPPRRPGAAPLLRAWQWRRPRRLPPAPRSLAAPLHVTERGPPGAALCVRGTGEAARRPDGSGRGGGAARRPRRPRGRRVHGGRPLPARLSPRRRRDPSLTAAQAAAAPQQVGGGRHVPAAAGRRREESRPPTAARPRSARAPPPRWPGGARGGGGREGRGRARREEPSGNSRARRAVRHAGVTSCARRHDVIAQASRPPPPHTHTRVRRVGAAARMRAVFPRRRCPTPSRGRAGGGRGRAALPAPSAPLPRRRWGRQRRAGGWGLPPQALKEPSPKGEYSAAAPYPRQAYQRAREVGACAASRCLSHRKQKSRSNAEGAAQRRQSPATSSVWQKM